MFKDELKNCEDVVTIPSQGAAILSCDPGRDMWNTVMGTFTNKISVVPAGQLYLYRYNDETLPALAQIRLSGYADAAQFHPLGIEYHEASSTLLVSNHHFDGPRIEVFRLDISSHPLIAHHSQTMESPLIRTPNAIVALNEHEFYFTNDHRFQIRTRRYFAMLETYAALPLGEIVHVKMHHNSSATIRAVAHLAYPNGLALLNSSMLAVALTGSCKVQLFGIRPDRSLVFAAEVRTPFMPDNLSCDQNGVLLISGHPHPPTLERLVKHRRRCLEPGLLTPQPCDGSRAPSAVSEWTWERGLENLYLSAAEYGSSSAAVRDSELQEGIVTGLYEEGILVWKSSK